MRKENPKYKPKPNPAWLLVIRMVYSVWGIIISVGSLQSNDVWDVWWWLGLLGIPLFVWLLLSSVVELVRDRKDRERERNEGWAPWG